MTVTRRLAAVAAVTGAVFVPVLVALTARVPNTTETPLIQSGTGRDPVPIELSYADYPGSNGHHRAAMAMRLQAVDALAAHQRVDLLVATFETTPTLTGATISVGGTDCQFTTRRGATFPNNGTVAFLRRAGCARMSGVPDGTLLLEVSFDGPGRVGVWTFRTEAGPVQPGHIYLADPTYADLGVLCEVRGAYVDEYGRSAYRRIDLLAYVWQVRDGSKWIWMVVGACAGLMLLTAMLLPDAATSRRAAARTVAAAAAAALSLASLYAVLTPPFQGPDEPSHFLGYGYVTGNVSLSATAEAWARSTHFQRIRFNPDERFRPIDIGQPYPATWDAVATMDFTRSSAPVRLWQALSPALARHDIPAQLLLLRLANAGLFALAVACGAMGLWSGGVRAPLTIVALPLIVPTIPFLAMHVSNYALAVSGYVLIASGTVMLGLRDRAPHLAGWYLGAGLAVALASTRSAMPMLPFVAMLIAGRLLLARPRPTGRDTLLAAGTFWAGLSCGLLLFAALLTSANALQLLGELGSVSGTWGAGFAVLVRHPLLAAAALWVSGVAFELAVTTAIKSLPPSVAPLQARWVRRAAVAMGAAVIALLLVSTIVPLPTLHAGIRGVTSPVTYVREAVLSTATIFRLAGHDLLMSSTFWAGIGWLDTYPPIVIPLLCAMSGLLLARGLWTAELRRRAWLMLTGGAVLLTVGIYAFAALKASPDVHGRYVMGTYLAGLYLIWIAGLDAGREDSEAPARGGALTVTAAIAHGLTLTTMLTRYF